MNNFSTKNKLSYIRGIRSKPDFRTMKKNAVVYCVSTEVKYRQHGACTAVHGAEWILYLDKAVSVK